MNVTFSAMTGNVISTPDQKNATNKSDSLDFVYLSDNE